MRIVDNKIALEIQAEILNPKFHTKLTYTPAWVSIRIVSRKNLTEIVL